MTSAIAPIGEIDPRFSDPTAQPVAWPRVAAELESAKLFWLTTVRRDGRPHVTPVVATWTDGSLYFSTGEDEQKAKNLASNTSCVATTGCNKLTGLDVVIEGAARRITERATLERIAAAFRAKYDDPFKVEAGDVGLLGIEGNSSWLFEIGPSKVLAFAKGDPFSQTRFPM